MEAYCNFKHVNYTFESRKNQGGYTAQVTKIVSKPNSTRVQIIGEHAEGKKLYTKLCLNAIYFDNK